MLVNHANSKREGVLWGSNGDAFAIRINLSFVGEIDTGNDVHQGRLARTVLA